MRDRPFSSTRFTSSIHAGHRAPPYLTAIAHAEERPWRIKQAEVAFPGKPD